MQNIIYWFRNDLRLRDNEAFWEAAQHGKVIPIYIFDERLFQSNLFGDPRTSIHRAKFLIECVRNLKENLRKKGSDLIIRYGKPEEIIFKLSETLKVQAVYASKEVTQDETTIEANLAKKIKPINVDIELIWTSTLYHPRDLPFQINYLPDNFTDFRKKIETSSSVRKSIAEPANLSAFPNNIEIGEVPTLEELGYGEYVFDERAAFEFRGGEDEALKRLNSYIWETQSLKTYKETRNGLVGPDFSSKLSAWLSVGCISSKIIYEEVKKYESTVVANESTYWLIFELLWRDYFYLIALKYGSRIFKRSGVKNDLYREWSADKEVFDKWAKGETGVPFVDANMRELNVSGYMSNRGRQNVASFLSKELGIDWTWGAAYFESKLIDYDACLNWGNWNYVAGVGNDPRENRRFNILKQAKTYDKEAIYIKKWLPELVNIPAELIHQNLSLNIAEQEKYHCFLGKDYPESMVEFEFSE